MLFLADPVPDFEKSLSMWRIAGSAVSPDGRYVAYVRQTTDWERNRFRTDLWVVEAATGRDVRLTRAGGSNGSPVWSPDSRRIAFRSDRTGTPQIYVVAPDGGEPQALTALKTGPGGFAWSPKGDQIALTLAQEPLKERSEKLGDFTILDEDPDRQDLALIPTPDELPEKPPEPTRITDGKTFTVGSFDWSPDGTRIAFDATPKPGFRYGILSDIYVLSLADKKVRKVVDAPGPDNGPAWSPDGRQIAYTTSEDNPRYFYTNSYIAIVSAEGGPSTVVTKAFDEEPSLVAWSPKGILFGAQERTESHLYRVVPGDAAQRLTGPGYYGGFSFTKDFDRYALNTGAPGRYGEIALSPTDGFRPQTLTNASEQIKGFRLASREVIRWKSKDGAEIEGILIKPADFDAKRRYPLLVVVHGGPTGTSTPVSGVDYAYPVEQFVAKGAVVLMPNYRGSAGYGEKFRSLNVRNLGIGDAWDVLSGCDALIQRGIADPTKMGCMGWSQGGYISAFLTTHTDRFKAISVGAGISDWSTYYVNTDITEFTRQYLGAIPWNDPKIYADTSPITTIRQAKTPTLIQHGSNDQRVPLANAYELYRGLQDNNVPSRLIVYSGFGHGITKPKEQLALYLHNWEWFDHYLWGAPLP